MTDLNDELFASSGVGARTATFPTVGTTHKGSIVSWSKQPDTLPDGTRRLWPSGDPRPDILVVIIQTDESEDADDDGLRALWMKYRMLEAVKDAVKKSGGKLDVGGDLAVKYERDLPAKQRGYNPEKDYRAVYKPAVPPLDDDDLL